MPGQPERVDFAEFRRTDVAVAVAEVAVGGPEVVGEHSKGAAVATSRVRGVEPAVFVSVRVVEESQ